MFCYVRPEVKLNPFRDYKTLLLGGDDDQQTLQLLMKQLDTGEKVTVSSPDTGEKVTVSSPDTGEKVTVSLPGLDTADMGNFRLVSNLTFISKVTERAVARQLHEYLSAEDLLPRCQSATGSNTQWRPPCCVLCLTHCRLLTLVK